MAKIKLEQQVFLPMPVSLVGANVGGRPNFQTAAWFTQVNFTPTWFAVSLGTTHHTTKGIEENGTFSLCLPPKALVAETDYCGLVSGQEKDKSGLFEVFYGELGTAPMAAQCPLCLELKVVKKVELRGDDLYIGELVAAYGDEEVLSQGVPDPIRIDPLFLTMPDNRYWALGDAVAEAYSVGKTLLDR